MNNKILIIGANGLIGKELLKVTDFEFLALDKNYKDTFSKFLKFDITNNDNIDQLITYLEKKKISLRGLVYLVSDKSKENFFTCSISEWETSFTVNYGSFFILLKKLYPFFVENTSIVAVSSQYSILPSANRIAYGTSKAALAQFSKNLDRDFALYSEKNIRVNIVSPGVIKESDPLSYYESYPGKKYSDLLPRKDLVPVNDVVNVIAFLLSDNAISLRGQNILIDNGFLY
ncbi:SDR family oxidoreductase [Streptococcus orisasini]|uniref:SDR family oxidoreductase n=1 Tax=Streptococcus orisasini TaxID=1080071 RepID=UPI00070D960B|nr:SDR family oxidoreductase [Streptococcus orisasini]